MLITGTSGNGPMDVNKDAEALTASTAKSKFDKAVEKGKAFSWDSTELDIDAGDTMLFVKNTSATESLVIERVIINGSNVICTWDIGIGTETTTASGTAVSGVNLNTAYSSTADSATALSDETAVADASVVARIKTPVTNTVILENVGIKLSSNHYIQVNQETESTSGSVIIHGYYE